MRVAAGVAAGPRLHTLEGIGHVRFLRLQMDKVGGVFEVEAEWLHSYEAEHESKTVSRNPAG